MTVSLAASLPGSMPLTSAFTEDLVLDELRKFDNASRFDVIVDSPKLPLGNQETASTEIEIEDLSLDAASGRFSAVLVGRVGATPRFQLPLEGRAQALVSVAVLSRSIGRGEQISADDLDWIELAPSKLQKGSLIDADFIIGSEAKRRLRPGRALTNRDVGPPQLVRRGQPVRIIYADGDLRLSALGTARDDGAFGEPIRVVNPESNLQVQGIATGPAEVTIGGSVMPGAGY
ncbi:MAG: flagellar basal body P-ring formation chaperone FlgA [Geminicoccaceae bacterium]